LRSEAADLSRQAKETTDPIEQQSLRKDASAKYAEAKSLFKSMGIEPPVDVDAKSADQSKTGYDPKTGQVFFNGKSLGSAKNEIEARKMVNKAKAEASKT
jgi:hypothetical protein